MSDLRIPAVPVHHRVDVFIFVLVIPVAFLCGWVGRTYQAEKTITVNKIHKVSIQEQYGTPQTITPSQVDWSKVEAAGFRCDYYAAKQTFICHR